MTPFIKPKGDGFSAKVLISRHRDGGVDARAYEIADAKGSADR